MTDRLHFSRSADECDEIGYSGTIFDIGEAVAQSLALAIDPFATGPQAEAARHRHRPDIAIADIQLGSSSGIDLALAWAASGGPRIILISGRDLTVDERSRLGQMRPHLLVKPVDVEALLRLLADDQPA